MTERTTRQTREQVQHEWADRGFGCELWVEPAGAVMSDFVYDTEQLIHLLDGALQIEMGGRTVRLQPGEELTIPGGMRHTIRNIHSATSRWLYGHPC